MSTPQAEPCTICRPGKQCLICQGDFGRIADRIFNHFIPRAETWQESNGRVRPSRSMPMRPDGTRDRREAPAQAERCVEATSRVSPRGLS